MPADEDVYHQASLDGSDSKRLGSVRTVKVGAALIGGACCLVLLAMVATSGTSAAEPTSLVATPTALRPGSVRGIGSGFGGIAPASLLQSAGPWKELAVAAIEASNTCGRDVSANAGLRAAVANLDPKHKAELAQLTVRVQKKAKQIATASDVPGVFPPFGYWDPFGLSAASNEGEIAFFREAELKHGRVCMLAALGFFVQERFHPLFGGNVEVPSAQMPLQGDLIYFWPAFIAAVAVVEIVSMEGRINFKADSLGFTPALGDGLVAGDLGFDPLGIKPQEPAELVIMQNKELAHARFAMITAAGMIAQELFTGEKLYGA